MIKNFNKKWFKEKIKGIKKFTVSVMTIVTISLTGCLGSLDDDKKNDNDKSNSTHDEFFSIFDDNKFYENDSYPDTITIDDNNNSTFSYSDENTSNDNNKSNSTFSYRNENESNENNDISRSTDLENYNINVSFNNINVEEYKSKIKDINVDYYYSEIFNTSLALAKYNTMKEYDSKHDLKYITSNNKVDKNKLKSKIEENTNSYLKTTIRKNYESLSSSDFDKTVDYIVEQIEKNLESGIDIYQLDDNLDNLIIVSGKMDANGLYDDEECVLALNLNVISRNSNPDFFEMIVKHETNHIMQSSSKIEKEKEGYSKNMGLVYKWDDLKFNTLGFQWFAEAGAENLMRLNVNSNYDTDTYKYIVDSMNIMTFSGINKEGFDIYTLPKISLQSDLSKLFDLYDCKTEKDRIELINLLYSFEIINNDRNSDFSDAYQTMYNQRFDDYGAVDIVNTKCCETLSKYYYYNLIDGLNNKEESLENIFANMSIFESYINSFTKIRNRQDGFRETFLNTYVESQEIFFELLSSKTNISVDDLNSMFNTFCYKNKNIIFNSKVLNKDNVNFINNISKQKMNSKMSQSIRSLSKKSSKML